MEVLGRKGSHEREGALRHGKVELRHWPTDLQSAVSMIKRREEKRSEEEQKGDLSSRFLSRRRETVKTITKKYREYFNGLNSVKSIIG